MERKMFEISFCQNLYDRIFLFFYSPGFLLTAETENNINKIVRDCITNLDSDYMTVSPDVLRNIKVRLIKEYLSIPTNVDELTRLISACTNTTRRFAINLVSKGKLSSTNDHNFIELKEKFFNEQNFTDQNNLRLDSYLKNDAIQKLAKKIDQDMEKSLTFQSFSQLIALEYKQELQKIIIDLQTKNHSVREPGSGEFADACLALILLQKNNRFHQAIQDLQQYILQNPDHPFEFIEAACLNYQGGINCIHEHDRG